MPINYGLLALIAVIVIIAFVLFIALLVLSVDCNQSCSNIDLSCASCNECSNELDQCCTSYSESCDSCSACMTECGESSESCSTSCTSCNDSCTSCATCGDSCSTSSSCCGSSTISSIIALVGTLISTFIGVFFVGLLQNFDSHSPILIIISGSIVLSFTLSGIRFDNQRVINRENNCNSFKSVLSKERVTKIGGFNIIHSHHREGLTGKIHELQVGNKYFCTGCYGTLLGVIISIMIMISYMYFGIEKIFLPSITILVPLCFIPIILKYTIFSQMKPMFRLVSNVLFPIGFCLMGLVLDATFSNWSVNTLLILVVIIIAYLRIIIARKDNNKLNTLNT